MEQTYPNTLAMNEERWRRGLTLDAFVDTLDALQADMRRRLREVRLQPGDSDFFALCTEPVFVSVMTEAWCSDCLMNLPILMRIVEAAPGFDLRVFGRAQSPDLDAAYRRRGITTIPVFTFFDAEFREIGTWVERPRAAHDQLARWRAEHPAYDVIRNAPDLALAQKQAQLGPLTAQLRREMERWYATSLQSATVAEIAVLLGSAGCAFGCQGVAEELVENGEGV
jgi:hypothetical protein